jgi:iron-sulfur cluster repair protein YtfE (RIC family)
MESRIMLPALDELAANTRAAAEANDPTAYLLAEHAWLRAVLDIYHGLVGIAAERPRVQADAVEMLRLLDLHIRKEEEVYFPAIESVMEELGQGSTFDMYGEHDAIRIRFDEFLSALAEGPGIGSAYGALTRSLLIHFENEEELIFAEAPQHLSSEARTAILEKLSVIDA